MAANTDRNLLLGKFALFALALAPIALLALAAFSDELGPNPVEMLQRKTGIWTLNFVMLTLAVSPLRSIAELPWLIRFRRMLGLFAFFYGTLHLLTYLVFDTDLDPGGILEDIVERRFITAGFAAWLLMIPLAATSADRMIRWIGGKRWQALQRVIYMVSILGTIHYFWLVKGTALLWPIGYAAFLSLLLGWRIWTRFRR